MCDGKLNTLRLQGEATKRDKNNLGSEYDTSASNILQKSKQKKIQKKMHL